MGWCPNVAFTNKSDEVYMVSYEGKYIDKIKVMGFRDIKGGFLLCQFLIIIGIPNFEIH